MKVYKDMSITDFDAWCGAVSTKDKIVEAGKEKAFDELIEELCPDGIDATKLNDILWFESEYVFEAVGLNEDGEEPSDVDDEEPNTAVD
jgi:hypothetical protein